MRMHIGAIVSLAEDCQKDEISFGRRYSRNGLGFLSGPSRARLDILGRNLLDRTIAKLRQLPSVSVRIIPESPATTSLLPARSAKANAFINAWENAVASHVQEGAQHLLLLRIGSYSDIDFHEVLHFHVQRGGALTQAYGPAGPLDLAVVDAECLRGVEAPYRKILSTFMPDQERFFYEGYINPLNQPPDLRRLVEDGLAGRCGLRPVGAEVTPGIWLGAEAQVDASVSVSAPAFIGARSRIANSCSITGSSSIERDCEIDCGTNVDQSCILQGIYVGVALDVRRSVVSPKRLFHLDRNVEVEIGDERLIGITKLAPLSLGGAFGWSRAE
jgi:hypothetical protein